MKHHLAGRRRLVDKSIQLGEITYLEPAAAVLEIERVAPKVKAQRPASTWPEPTPTSLRREQAEKSRRGVAGPTRRDVSGPAAAPSPRPARRTPTPEELAAAQEISSSLLLVTAEEHAGHKKYGGDHDLTAHILPSRR
jgi:hypothetical protein